MPLKKLDLKIGKDEAVCAIVNLIYEAYGTETNYSYWEDQIKPIINNLVESVKCDMLVQEINRVDRAVSEYKRAIEFRT